MNRNTTKLADLIHDDGQWSDGHPLNRRTYNVLVRHGITTMGDLRRQSIESLLMCKGMGKASLCNVMEVLWEHGMYGL